MGNYIPDKMIVWCGHDQYSGYYEIDSAKFLLFVQSHDLIEKGKGIFNIEEFIHANHSKTKMSLYDESEVKIINAKKYAMERIKIVTEELKILLLYDATPEQLRKVMNKIISIEEGSYA